MKWIRYSKYTEEDMGIGAEELLLDVAQSIEDRRPWPLLAPI